MTPLQLEAHIEVTIKALTLAMQNGIVEPVRTNAVLTELTYIKMEIEDNAKNSSQLLKIK